MKKDTSQLGINAREAVKFLDRVTSGQDSIPIDRISIQEPDQQFATWAEVEKLFPTPETDEKELPESERNPEQTEESTPTERNDTEDSAKEAVNENDRSPSALTQMLLSKLNFAKPPEPLSPKSSPPTTPVSSAPQSSKTSPEVASSTIVDQGKSRSRASSFLLSSQIPAIADSIKPLINSVTWMLSNREDKPLVEALFLTNNGEKAHIVRAFGFKVKNIHQLRAAIGSEDQELKNQSRYRQKNSTSPPTIQQPAEPKTLFKYDDNSEEDEVVYKPRSRPNSRPNSADASRLVKAQESVRDKPVQSRTQGAAPVQSPKATPKKPANVPVMEIDPDSFDRGPSTRPTQPIFNPSGNQGSLNTPPARPFYNGAGNTFPRGRGQNGFQRGSVHNGFGRGSFRGRGKLFTG